MIAAPAGLVARYGDDEDCENRPVLWIDPSSDHPAFVLDDQGQVRRAEDLPDYLGLGWQHPVVAAIAGYGWKLTLDRKDELPVEAWLIRGDGRIDAVVVGRRAVVVFNSEQDNLEFIPPADEDDR